MSGSSDLDLRLGVSLLLGPGLLDLDLEQLPEPDLDGEEDITNVLLAAKEKDIKVSTFYQNMIVEAIYLNFHYTIEYSLTLMCTALSLACTINSNTQLNIFTR